MRRAELHGSLVGHQSEEQSLARVLDRVEPDPLFRRRLRTTVLNYHVAMREGHLERRRRPGRRMGAIGRSVLYASVILAMGVTAVGAASQESLPGDPLYAVKIRLEEIRMQIAPPSVRDDLATLAVAERTSELQGLVAAGDWTSAMAAAERLAAAEAALFVLEPEAAGTLAASHAHDVLQAVLTNAPAAARPALERALEASDAMTTEPWSPGQPPHAAENPAQVPHPSPPPHPSQPPTPRGENGSRPDGDAKGANAHD